MAAPRREPSEASGVLFRSLEAEIKGRNGHDVADAVLSLLAAVIVEQAGPDVDACRRMTEMAVEDLKRAVTIRHALRKGGENLALDLARLQERGRG